MDEYQHSINPPPARNWDGLTIGEVVKQSAAIHPDWTWADHRDYLLSETAFEEHDLNPDLPSSNDPPPAWVRQCSLPPRDGSGCFATSMRGHQLCLVHQVGVTRLLLEVQSS